METNKNKQSRIENILFYFILSYNTYKVEVDNTISGLKSSQISFFILFIHHFGASYYSMVISLYIPYFYSWMYRHNT